MKGVILGLFVISAAFCTVNAYVAASAPLTHPGCLLLRVVGLLYCFKEVYRKKK